MRAIRIIENNEFDRVYEIMEQSFPPDEHRSYREQKALLANSHYTLYTFADEESVSVFMAIWDFCDMAFIEHFAVDKARRGSGLGSQMLAGIREELKKPIFLEVEPPINDITKRRVDFYKRNGFFLNDYDYVQPAMSSGRAPVPLMIMTSDREVSPAEFENIRKMLYLNVYNLDLPENKRIKNTVCL